MWYGPSSRSTLHRYSLIYKFGRYPSEDGDQIRVGRSPISGRRTSRHVLAWRSLQAVHQFLLVYSITIIFASSFYVLAMDVLKAINLVASGRYQYLSDSVSNSASHPNPIMQVGRLQYCHGCLPLLFVPKLCVSFRSRSCYKADFKVVDIRACPDSDSRNRAWHICTSPIWTCLKYPITSRLTSLLLLQYLRHFLLFSLYPGVRPPIVPWGNRFSYVEPGAEVETESLQA